MAKDAPYTVTIYVAAPGTPLKNGGTSAAGHMYLAVQHEGVTQSFGFARARHGASTGPGAVTYGDVVNYENPYYARTMEISKAQFEKIVAFGDDPVKHGFNMEYSGLSKSCIDFTWGVRSTTRACTSRSSHSRMQTSRVRSSLWTTSLRSRAFERLIPIAS
ncbi:hypothetical protein ACIGHF_15970 [Stenotrophomonas sp. NPDC077464]|uniref:hypothetical protein n=1 Tax=unclassified Stenotrophomonas TaxID=196198 RepID=UPI0037D0F4D6